MNNDIEKSIFFRVNLFFKHEFNTPDINKISDEDLKDVYYKLLSDCNFATFIYNETGHYFTIHQPLLRDYTVSIHRNFNDFINNCVIELSVIKSELMKRRIAF